MNNSGSSFSRFSSYFHLGVVYIVWGSTYLAIRIAVREGSGFPPFIAGLSRVLVAGLLLIAWTKFRGNRIRLNRDEALTLFIAGSLLWPLANGLVMFGEQRAESGLAALLVASMPIWSSGIESIYDRKLPTWRLIGSLLIGFSGVLLLAVPSLQSDNQADVIATLALIAAPISWALGSTIQARRPVNLVSTASSGYQMLFGGVGFLIFTLLLKEPWPTPTYDAWMAWGYLVIFGSLLAYTSYVKVLQMLPIKIVMTYSYVNPVIAVFLGWLILQEAITPWTIGGSLLVLLGVAGVFNERNRK